MHFICTGAQVVYVFWGVFTYGPKWQFLLILLVCGPGVIVVKSVRTSFVPWVELPVQRRLCPIFMSGVGLPDIHEYYAG